MAMFITQGGFDMNAASAALISEESSKTIGEVVELINRTTSFKDKNLSQDIEIAATKIQNFALGVLPSEALTAYLAQMQFCIKNYNPDGTKKRKKILNGEFFNKEKKEITNKVKNCIANIGMYHTLIIHGSIPIVPQ